MDVAADQERRGKPGEGFPVAGTEGPTDEERGTAEASSQEHGTLDETLPADRAGWEAEGRSSESGGTTEDSST